MNELKVGTIHTMKVTEQINNTYTVTKQATNIPLHEENTTDSITIGQMVDVFLYHNIDGKIEATMQFPHVMAGTYGWAKVVNTVPHLGAFVQIGLPRDVLVPYSDLPAFKSVWPEEADQLYVTLSHDKQDRLLAKLANEEVFLDLYEFAGEVALNTRITGTIIETSREGAVVITEENYRGFIHHTEVEREPRLGETVHGRVIDAKENGSINVSLLPMKHERIDSDAESILTELEASGGVIPFSDNSSPEQIRHHFQMSKSSFKRALGRLMREQKIEQKDGKTYLIDDTTSS